MKKSVFKILFFAIAFLLCITFSTNYAYGQPAKAKLPCPKATDTQLKELSQAIYKSDLATVKDLIDNKGVDVNATLGTASTTGKEKITPLMQAILRWSFYEIDPPNPEIVGFLLERGADFNVQQGGETLLAITKSSIYTLQSWRDSARNEGKVQYAGMTKSFPEWISATEQVVALLERYESGNQVIKPDPNCAAQETLAKKEVVSTSDWVQDLMSNSKTIYIRNNSKTKAVRITTLEIYDCDNLLVAECGSSLINQTIPAGATVSIRTVSRSNDTRPFSFRYKYSAEFVDGR